MSGYPYSINRVPLTMIASLPIQFHTITDLFLPQAEIFFHFDSCCFKREPKFPASKYQCLKAFLNVKQYLEGYVGGYYEIEENAERMRQLFPKSYTKATVKAHGINYKPCAFYKTQLTAWILFTEHFIHGLNQTHIYYPINTCFPQKAKPYLRIRSPGIPFATSTAS